MNAATHRSIGTPGSLASSEAYPSQWQLRRQLVLRTTAYLMWGLPVIIGLDLIFERNFVQTLGSTALTGIIGLPGGYLIGRSVQTAIRERQQLR